jgi:UDP-N-acetylglucosamine/UDP-N-acetylgalactosamine diphosphorylase
VVKRKDPKEKVGLICEKNGKTAVVEYFEMETVVVDSRNENGEFVYNYAATLNNLYSLDVLLAAVKTGDLIYRKAHKKVNYIDEHGTLIIPEKENAYKYELSSHDFFGLYNSCLPFEVIREKEFAPIKNKTGVDSVDTARVLLHDNGVSI